MSKVRPTDDDNVDLFELFETLWDSKWVISAFVALATLMGFAYSQLAQPVYYISAPYTLNIYSVNAQQICGNNVTCLEKVAKKTSGILIRGWMEWKLQGQQTFLTFDYDTISFKRIPITVRECQRRTYKRSV